MLRKAVALSMAVLCLVLVASSSGIRIPLLTEPSPTNPGPGGLTKFVSLLEKRGYEVVAPRSLSEALQYLNRVSPEVSALVVLGLSRSDAKSVASVKRWVSKGGELVVLDELSDVDQLLNAVGMSKTPPVIAVANATCLNNLTVLFDVFSVVSGGKAICVSSGMVLAVEKHVGKGLVVLVGDSSLVINYLSRFTVFKNNTAFLLKIIGERRVIAIYYPPLKGVAKLRLLEISGRLAMLVESASRAILRSSVALPLLIVSAVLISILIAGGYGEELRSAPRSLDRVIMELQLELTGIVRKLRELTGRGDAG